MDQECFGLGVVWIRNVLDQEWFESGVFWIMSVLDQEWFESGVVWIRSVWISIRSVSDQVNNNDRTSVKISCSYTPLSRPSRSGSDQEFFLLLGQDHEVSGSRVFRIRLITIIG